MNLYVFDYCELGLRSKLIVYKMRAIENGFLSFSVIFVIF